MLGKSKQVKQYITIFHGASSTYPHCCGCQGGAKNVGIDFDGRGNCGLRQKHLSHRLFKNPCVKPPTGTVTLKGILWNILVVA